MPEPCARCNARPRKPPTGRAGRPPTLCGECSRERHYYGAARTEDGSFDEVCGPCASCKVNPRKPRRNRYGQAPTLCADCASVRKGERAALIAARPHGPVTVFDAVKVADADVCYCDVEYSTLPFNVVHRCEEDVDV